MKIAIYKSLPAILSLILSVVVTGCEDDQNSFVPYVQVNKYISITNVNSLYIPGNSLNVASEGYAGLIVICINESQYYAFDACCPYEGTRTCKVSPESGKTGDFTSSNPIATCSCCGSTYNLFGGGYPTKGASGRNLKMYGVSVVGGRLWVHN